MELIDAHSHFGISYMGPICDYETYKFHVEKLNVTTTVAASTACPEFILPDGNRFRPCIWKIDEHGGPFYHEQIVTPDGNIILEQASHRNPYRQANENLFALSTLSMKKGSKNHVLVMPLHHPLLDDENEVLRMLGSYPSVGLKVHGIASFTSPKDISENTISLLKQTRKPLIVHTDYFQNANTPLEIAYQLNNPEGWIKWAIANEVKILITHGARLSAKAIKLAKGHKNIKIGLAPDLLIEAEPDRLDSPVDSVNTFLLQLFKQVDASQIIFDIDYRWNVQRRNQWIELDWKMVERIESTANALNIKQVDLNKIYYQNAVDFFQLDKYAT